MHWYSHGESKGRYIGHTSSFDVYERTISVRQKQKEQEPPDQSFPEEIVFNYGPSTGGLMESVNFRITTPGELISKVRVNSAFKRRAVKISGRRIDEAAMVVERINGFHSASNTICFLNAVEDALNIKTPKEVQMARIACIELERIRSHLTVIERLCSDASFGVPHNSIAALREEVSRLIGDMAGHRYMFGIHGVGSISGSYSAVPERLVYVADQFRELLDSLLQSKIFLNRLQGNGITRDEWLVGPAARASGIRVDSRLESAFLPYDDLNFQPVTRYESDAFGRFMTRSQEIFSSVGLIERALDQNPDTLHEEQEAPNGTGEGAARLESPPGDIFYYVKVRDGYLEKVEMISPGHCNVNAFMNSIKGNILTDFPFNWDSFGIWISEMEVELE